MKNKFAQFLMLVALTVGLTVFANAQSDSVNKINIPFNFIVGEKLLKAGEYSATFGVSQAMKDNIFLRSTDGKQAIIVSQTVSKNSDKNLKNGNFVFYVGGDHYYLAEINTAQKSVKIRSSHLKKMPKTKKHELALVK